MKKTLTILMSIILLCGMTISSQAQTTSKEKIAKETMQYVTQGSAAYLKQDYKKAIQFYSKALELEKKDPTLEKNIWRVLVYNLGMSYGMSGDNKKAKEIFEYGLSKDDKYPGFYYNLACAYAEMNDLDNAIINLKRAFKYKENMIPGERIPNPATDDSFSRFLKNEKFRCALDELNSTGNVKVKIPKEGWSISFDSPPLSQEQESRNIDDYAFKATSGRFNISLFVEKPRGTGSSHKDCYQFYWPRASQNPMIAKNTVLTSDRAKYVRVQYDVFTEFQGKLIRQRNVNYYFAFRGKWIDVHISMIEPIKEDEGIFAAFDKSLDYGS